MCPIQSNKIYIVQHSESFQITNHKSVLQTYYHVVKIIHGLGGRDPIFDTGAILDVEILARPAYQLNILVHYPLGPIEI